MGTTAGNEDEPVFPLPPPEQGQFVEVRLRRYVVAEVQRNTLVVDILKFPALAPHHLVTLNSVEDGALGEELQVLWELEPGVQVIEQGALPAPDGFDAPVRFAAFLDAVRWGAIASADTRTLQAPFRSGVKIEDYQLDPLVRAIQMPRVNLLIADDVGLGKTIEAGLVVQELVLRYRVRTVLIICPAALQVQWHDQMRDKFGLDFRIVDTTLMRTLRRERGLRINPWTHYPRLITSIDYLKREHPMRLFREALPADGEPTYPRPFDLLIVDECHNMAPVRRGTSYATDSLRTRTIRRLVPHFEHRLFLSATPHNGYPESFMALLELLDNQRFARGLTPERQSVREQVRSIMIRRLKSELPPAWDGTPRFPVRQLAAIEVAYPEDEQRIHTTLQRYATLRQQATRDPTERMATEFVLKLLKKRLFSSPEAFAITLERHQHTLTVPRRSRAAPRPTLNTLRQQIEQVDEAFGDDDEADETTADAMDLSSRLLTDMSAEEAALLHDLHTWSQGARGRADAKATELIRWLKQHIQPDGKWGDRRVIIFTEYRDTQRWLQEQLTGAGLRGQDRLMLLSGGMPSDQRERIKAAFQANPAVAPVRILLATDAASEGIDLQNHCAHLIHYEIPWNPNRLEQRNGRIDRHGQRASEVHIFHFVSQGWNRETPPVCSESSPSPHHLNADLEFLFRAALKVNAIREDLGNVGPVIATQVEEAMLGRRTRLETGAAEQRSEPVRRLLTFERKLREQIARHMDQLQETRHALHLEPARIQQAVSIALELAGQPPLQAVEVEGIWPDPTGTHQTCPVFSLPPLTGSWSACAEGVEHPHTGVARPIVFDHSLVRDRDDVVLVHLNHRLVQMALRLLRAEVWSPTSQQKLYRVTARVVPGHGLETPAIVGYARLLMLGSDHQRLHEEIITAGGVLREGRLVRFKSLKELERVLEASREGGVSEHLRQRLAQQWPNHVSPLMQALEARMHERSRSLTRVLDERAAKECADMTAILTELRATIQAELEQPAVQQLTLWTEPEREAFAHTMDHLRLRVEQIPAEIERETRTIRARYADPQTRLFPIAVMFLVPEGVV
jgi:superfamily II DNA or RNA helicase